MKIEDINEILNKYNFTDYTDILEPYLQRKITFDVHELDEETYNIAVNKHTQPPFVSPIDVEKFDGIYACKCCKQPLFESSAKFVCGCGWPSFYAPIHQSVVTYKYDYELRSERVEFLCSYCNSHLGHVFNDGILPTNLRYCTNGAMLVHL